MSMEVRNLYTSLVNQNNFKGAKVKTKTTSQPVINDKVSIGSGTGGEDKTKELSRMALTKNSGTTGKPASKASDHSKFSKAMCMTLAGVSLIGAVGLAAPTTAAAAEKPSTEIHQEVQADSTRTGSQSIGQKAKALFSWGQEKVDDSVKDFQENSTRENHTDKNGNFTIVNQKYKKQLNNFLDRNQGRTEADTTRGPIQTVVETAEVIADKTTDKVKEKAPVVVETGEQVVNDVKDAAVEVGGQIKKGAKKVAEKTTEAVKDFKESNTRENHTDEDGNFTIVNQKYKKQLGNFWNKLKGN